MKVKGKIFAGVGRGEPLIEKYSNRLVNILGFEPFPGTLNVRMETKVNLKDYATQKLEHILMDGRPHVDAYFALVTLIFGGLKKECWAMKDAKNVYEDDVAELVAENSIMEELGIKNGDEVIIEFSGKAYKRTKVPGFGIVQDFLQKEHRNNI